jgi:hypothetical protein
MRQSLLLSYRWKLPALLLLIGFIVLEIAATFYEFEFSFLHRAAHMPGPGGISFSNDNLTDEFAISGVILSLLMLSFCAERIEDEYVAATRLRCWQWAVLANYGLLLIAIWLVFGTTFLVILYYNILTTLVLFLGLFYGRLYILPLIFRKAAL